MIPQIASFTGSGSTVGEAMGRAEARANGWLATAGITGEQVLSVSAQTIDVQGKVHPADHWLHTLTIMVVGVALHKALERATGAEALGDAVDDAEAAAE